MTTLCQIPGVGNVCAAASAPVGAAAGAVTDGVLGAIRTAVINACAWAVIRVVSGLGASSNISLTSAAVGTNYRFMVAVAVVCMLPLIGLAAVSALLRSDPGALARAVFGALPAAALLTVVGIQLTQTFVDVVDAVSARLLAGHAGDGAVVAHAIPAALGGTSVPVVIGVAVAIAAMCAALAVWVELLVRAAAVEVAVIFLPLVFAGIVWPATARYARRLAEILAALTLSKLVIIGIVSLGMAELTGATIPGVLAGTAMLGLAAFAPFVLLSLIPMAVDAGQLSQSRRSTASLRTVSRDVGAAESAMRRLRTPTVSAPPRPRVTGLAPAAARGPGGTIAQRPRIIRRRR
jgi:type IV secretion system protein TrbL